MELLKSTFVAENVQTQNVRYFDTIMFGLNKYETFNEGKARASWRLEYVLVVVLDYPPFSYSTKRFRNSWRLVVVLYLDYNYSIGELEEDR